MYEIAKKQIQIDEETFLKKYHQLYIDKEILSIIRRLMEYEVKLEKEELKKTTNEKS